MTTVEDPVHRIASEDVGDFLFGGQHNERMHSSNRILPLAFDLC
jgi:hypothetical protein